MDALLVELSTRILQHSGPFRVISDAGMTAFAHWLSQPPAGQTRSRRDLCGALGIKSDLMDKLPFVGALACANGLQRVTREAGLGVKPNYELQYEDLEPARKVISASYTILCPDVPD